MDLHRLGVDVRLETSELGRAGRVNAMMPLLGKATVLFRGPGPPRPVGDSVSGGSITNGRFGRVLESAEPLGTGWRLKMFHPSPSKARGGRDSRDEPTIDVAGSPESCGRGHDFGLPNSAASRSMAGRSAGFGNTDEELGPGISLLFWRRRLGRCRSPFLNLITPTKLNELTLLGL